MNDSIQANEINHFFFHTVSQTQSVNNEETSMQTSSNSPPVVNKPDTSPVNTTSSSINVTQPGQSPVQQQSNESVSTPARNQVNNSGQNLWGTLSDDQIFAKSPPEPHHPRGWLVDLINR